MIRTMMIRSPALLLAVAIAAAPAAGQGTASAERRTDAAPAQPNPAAAVTAQRLRAATDEPRNWMTYYGGYAGQRYSALDQVHTGNVHRLHTAWSKDFDRDEAFEATPLVVDGVMYVTTGGQTAVYALDARTGRELWKHETHVPDSLALCCGWVNRGVAVADGKVFFVTADVRLHALDAATGRPVWERAYGDPELGYAATLAPLVVKDRVVVGVSGGEYGIRGYLDAFDVRTGEPAWRFWTVPGPGEPGHESWGGAQTWRTGAGPTWITGTYDPELDLLYWGTGNPGPDFNGEVRPGDNLYTSSVVALDPDDGTLRWHFQFTPHDVWDYDAVGVPMLVDLPFAGGTIRGLIHADKNGYFYLLDRADGRFRWAVPFVRQTWTLGVDPRTGRPVVNPEGLPGAAMKPMCPNANGGTEWNHMAFSPRTGLAYVPVIENCVEFRTGQAFYVPKMPFYGGYYSGKAFGPGESHGFLRAIDAATGRPAWEIRSEWPVVSNVLATGGGLVFWAEADGTFHAVDADTGRRLWRWKAQTGIRGGAMTYQVDGVQYVALPVGWGGPVVPELDHQPKAHTLQVFRLR